MIYVLSKKDAKINYQDLLRYYEHGYRDFGDIKIIRKETTETISVWITDLNIKTIYVERSYRDIESEYPDFRIRPVESENISNEIKAIMRDLTDEKIYKNYILISGNWYIAKEKERYQPSKNDEGQGEWKLFNGTIRGVSAGDSPHRYNLRDWKVVAGINTENVYTCLIGCDTIEEVMTSQEIQRMRFGQ